MFGVLLVVTFVVWRCVEGAIDVHAIDSSRREATYWAVVVLTFALGTAAGDLVAATFHLGFLVAGAVFLAALVVVVLLHTVHVVHTVHGGGRRMLGTITAVAGG